MYGYKAIGQPEPSAVIPGSSAVAMHQDPRWHYLCTCIRCQNARVLGFSSSNDLEKARSASKKARHHERPRRYDRARRGRL